MILWTILLALMVMGVIIFSVTMLWCFDSNTTAEDIFGKYLILTGFVSVFLMILSALFAIEIFVYKLVSH